MLDRWHKALIIGSAPDATRCESWAIPDDIAVICTNNAWMLDVAWRFHIFPNDYPKRRRPSGYDPGQTSISNSEEHVDRGLDYQSHVERFGGLLWCGATMAYSAGYWALSALRCTDLAFLGSDMVYDKGEGQTHFYGRGRKDPLRRNLSLRNLKAKSSRLMALARLHGCRVWNLSKRAHSRLTFPRIEVGDFFAMPKTIEKLPRMDRETLRRIEQLVEKERRIYCGLSVQGAAKAGVSHAEVDQIDSEWERLALEEFAEEVR